MLTVDTKARFSAEQIMNNCWIQNNIEKDTCDINFIDALNNMR
jgi:hypothetical protein